MDKLYVPEHCDFNLLTVLTAQSILTGCRFISTKNKNYSITETKDKFVRCRVQYCKNRGTRRRKNKKQKTKLQRAKQSSNFWSILSYYDRTCFRSSKDNGGKIWFFFRLKMYFSLRIVCFEQCVFYFSVYCLLTAWECISCFQEMGRGFRNCVLAIEKNCNTCFPC